MGISEGKDNTIQTKCSSCEAEEENETIQPKPIFESDQEKTQTDIQKQDDEKAPEDTPEIQAKSKIESNVVDTLNDPPGTNSIMAADSSAIAANSAPADLLTPLATSTVQRVAKIENDQESDEEQQEDDSLQRSAIYDIGDEDEHIQQKCSKCEEKEKNHTAVQKKLTIGQPNDPYEKEADVVADTVVQKLARDSDSTSKSSVQPKLVINSISSIQRRTKEMEKTEYPILFKRSPSIQLVGGGTNESNRRNRIVEIAKGMVEKIEASKDDGSGRRVGAKHLLEIFHLAANDAWPDPVIEQVRYVKEFPHWCGIFAVYCIKKAGIDLGYWKPGRGVKDEGTLEPTENPQPGDIGYFEEKQHHCIIKAVHGDTIESIDGNSGNFSEVVERSRPRSQFAGFLTAFTGNEKVIQPRVSGKSPNQSADLEGKLNRAKGLGSPMDVDTRTGMESAFGKDFSEVRIHTDARAVQMNQDLNAQAFTHGNDIYFNEGKYNPQAQDGQHLLAHELTHTVQQGATIKQKSNDEIVQPSLLDDLISLGEGAISVGREGLSSAAATAGELIDQGVEFAEEVGEDISELTQEGIRLALDRVAPGLWDLLTGGLSEKLKEKIVEEIATLFAGIKKQIQNGELAQKIKNIFANSKEKLKEWRETIEEECGDFYQQIDALVEFLSDLLGPAFDEIKSRVQIVARYVSAFWDSYGKPAWEAIQEFAGDAWAWLKSTANWIWEVTAPIRETLADIWNWIKTQLGILQESASSIWNALKEIAATVWGEIKTYIQPILGPLRKIGGILLLISPFGPIILLYQAAPHIWNALRWIATNWKGWETLIQLKEYFANEILPLLQEGLQTLKSLLAPAIEWITTTISQLSEAVTEFFNSLGIIEMIEAIRTVIGDLRTVFHQIKEEFDKFVASIREEFDAVLSSASNLLSKLWECLRPIISFITGLVILFANPYFWPVYAVALMARLAWEVLPDDLKIAAIDYIIGLARGALDYFKPAGIIGSIWNVFKSGATAFLDRLDEYSADEKIRMMEKMLTFLVDPQTYGGYLMGMISGFVKQAVDLVTGVVSLTINIPNILTGIINFLRDLVPDLSFIQQIRERVQNISQRIEELLDIDSFVERVTEFLQNAPEIIIGWIEEKASSAAGKTEEWGRKFAESLFGKILNLNNYDLAFYIGEIIGRIVFEVLLTKGIGALLSKLASGISWLRNAMNAIRSGVRSAASGLLTKARALLDDAIKAVGDLFRRFGRRFGELFDDFKKLVDDFIAWVMRAIRGAAADRAQWLAFKTAVATRMAPINNQYEGVTRRAADNMFVGSIAPFRTVADRLPTLGLRVRDHDEDGYWHLYARRRFGLNPVARSVGEDVGRVLMNRRRRWGKGKKAIERRIEEGFDRSQLNKRDLDRIFSDYKQRYKYKELESQWDSHENDWNIMGEMSPRLKVAKIRVHTMPISSGDPPTIQRMNGQVAEVKIPPPEPPPLVKPNFRNNRKASSFEVEYLKQGRTTGGSPASSNSGRTLPGWSALPIEFRTGRGERWVKMHLLTEMLGGPALDSNLTPARSALNTEFYYQIERHAQGAVNHDKVIWYDVRISYHSSPHGDYINSITMEWGPYAYENDSWRKKRSGFRMDNVSIGGRHSRNPEPPDLSGGPQVVNMNSAGRIMIEGLSPIFDQSFAEVITSERRHNGDYRSITDLTTRLARIRSRFSSITTPRIVELRLLYQQGSISF